MCFYNSNLFVISGGPGSGKTTLLAELARLGLPHEAEVARLIIQEQVRDGGTALPWADREMYTRLMLQRSIESYLKHSSASGPVFFDRGIPDTLGYARLIGLDETQFIELACRQYRYAPLVFLAPPWQEIYMHDAERKQDFTEAERTFEQLRNVYRECGYDVLEIPRAPAPARAQFVHERLHSR
jgi:predicted ATPase